MRLVTSLALSGCVVAALSACTGTARPAPEPPAVAGAGPTPTASAGLASPSAGASPSAPAARPSRTTAAAKPAARRPSWKTVDWEKAAYRDLGRCVRTEELPDTAEIGDVRYADLTGDGVAEAVVAASCRTTTAQNPVRVFVYDGTDRRPPLHRLVTIGAGQYLMNADIRTRGRTVTVRSTALSDTAPRCCPDLRITQRYEWTGSEFRRASIDETPIEQE